MTGACVAATGGAQVRALYAGGEEEPPDLCEACAEIRREAHPLRGRDEHSDCRNYCRFTGRRGSSATPSAGGGGGSLLSSILGSMTVEDGAAHAGAKVPLPPTNSAELKTEFR